MLIIFRTTTGGGGCYKLLQGLSKLKIGLERIDGKWIFQKFNREQLIGSLGLKYSYGKQIQSTYSLHMVPWTGTDSNRRVIYIWARIYGKHFFICFGGGG